MGFFSSSSSSLPLYSLPLGRWFRGGTLEGRNSKGERKGGEEFRNGAGPVPQVPHRKGSGMGRAGEEMCRGVGSTTAGRAEVVRASSDPLQVGV